MDGAFETATVGAVMREAVEVAVVRFSERLTVGNASGGVDPETNLSHNLPLVVSLFRVSARGG